MKSSYKFLHKHMVEFNKTYRSLRDDNWSLNLPVFIFDRDWFKLKKIRIHDLAKELKTDNSQEAPEIKSKNVSTSKSAHVGAGHDSISVPTCSFYLCKRMSA